MLGAAAERVAFGAVLGASLSALANRSSSPPPLSYPAAVAACSAIGLATTKGLGELLRDVLKRQPQINRACGYFPSPDDDYIEAGSWLDQ